MNKKKVFKTIGILVLIIVILMLLYVIRNTIIVTKLQKNIRTALERITFSLSCRIMVFQTRSL